MCTNVQAYIDGKIEQDGRGEVSTYFLISSQPEALKMKHLATMWNYTGLLLF